MQVLTEVVTETGSGRTTVVAGTIEGPDGALALRIEEPVGADHGVDLVVCHPHPLYGGSLDNKVVHTLARAARDEGVRAVRFNFRGVGASAGQHDHGRGEVDDLLAVVAALALAAPGRRLLLAGFSFGAFVAASALARLTSPPLALLLVAPPVHYAGFDTLPPFGVPVTVFQGSDDDVVEAVAVADWCGQRQPPLAPRLFATGHFFHGALPELKDAAQRWIRHTLAAGNGFPGPAPGSTLPPP